MSRSLVGGGTMCFLHFPLGVTKLRGQLANTTENLQKKEKANCIRHVRLALGWKMQDGT